MQVIRTLLPINASSQYTNFDFNSLASFNGINIGIDSEGIKQLGSSQLDDSTLINSQFSLVETDFGVSNPKKLRFVILGFESSSDLILEVSADGSTYKSYDVKVNKKGQQRVRVPINMDLRGRYWYFTIKNKLGAALAVDSIEIVAVVLSQGNI